MITDPILNWKKMAGNTPTEQRLNALLTERFVASEAPYDECIEEATMIVTVLEDEEGIRSLLMSSFATVIDEGGEHLVSTTAPLVDAVLPEVMAILGASDA
jgi:hypothetical protein